MMDRFFFGVVLVSALALVGGGCGGGKSCEELCNLSNACSDFPNETPCKQQCEEAEVFVKEADCKAEQEAYDACRSELEDICTVASDCGDEALGFSDCLDDYCDANAGAPSCPTQ